MATFSSALAYALSCVGKPGLLEALKCLYAGVYVGTVPTGASPSAFQTLIDVKLDRTSAPLSERSVVMVISPLQCHSLCIVVTFAENWSQSKYVVWRLQSEGLVCIRSDPRDLLLECVLSVY